jgi:membrane associated rhomboid family serine protease
MIPLHDDNPTTLTPIVTVAVIAICVLVFLWQLSLPPGAAERAVYGLGLIPAVLFDRAQLPPEIASVPAELSIVTSMFLHGGLLHLGGNMLYLWIFGNNVEDSMGHGRFVAFYLLCGLAAALAQAFQAPDSTVPMIGASGAIGGVLGGYFMLFPRAHVLVLVPIGFFITTLRVPAVVVLGLWFVLQFVNSAMTVGQAGGVAYWAHIGGFLAGVVLIVPFRNKAFPLFGGHRNRPRAAQPPHRSQRPPGEPSSPDRKRRDSRKSRIPRSGRGPWDRRD